MKMYRVILTITKQNYGTYVQKSCIFGKCCKTSDGALKQQFFLDEKLD